MAVGETLDELELNMFERRDLSQGQYARKLDFGHTFSPHIEVATGHRLLHGEAVAIDMAISAVLADRLGLLDVAARDRLLDLLCRLGLPIHCAGIDTGALHASLSSIVRHRNGKLNLALPSRIGDAVFVHDLSEVSVALLDEIWLWLARLSANAVAPQAATLVL